MAIATSPPLRAPQPTELAPYRPVCPHMGGPLDQGHVANGEVTCPWHRYRFDLTTGRGRGLARMLGLCLARRDDARP